ncbi:MAG: CBS domain-containing protein [alpha proteobacterium HIMB59]|jgi:predicted transcriptional regulator|nr:MAG: CBS domain-containing protein [alpha proteobacterium HIMB59]|tara:strand:- start:2884 stop:3381 length:498 start_codon:yes stop_codon:yes gene_type:complete
MRLDNIPTIIRTMSTIGSIEKVKLNSLFKFFGPDSTVSEIADLMDLEDIGAVPILDDSYLLLGIVSERDIVRKLVKNGRDSDLVTAKDIMTKNIITVKKDTTLGEAVKLMKVNNIRHLPIIDEDKKIVNFISHRDIMSNSYSNKKINYFLLAFALILLPAIIFIK